jgi:hypothetical protein
MCLFLIRNSIGALQARSDTKWHEAIKCSGVTRLQREMINGEARLDSWKEIAEHLNRDVRTVVRWEKERGLPVHRIPGAKRSGVYAWPSELDLWLQGGEPQTQTANGIGPTLQAGPEAAPNLSPPPSTPGIRNLWIAAILLLILVAGGVLRFRSWQEIPRLVHPTQITSDGRSKGHIIATDSFLFYTSAYDDRDMLTRTRLDGREPLLLPMPLRNFSVLDASADGSKVLLREDGSKESNGPLWVFPTNGRPPERLAGLCATAAAWSPDGQRLAYAVGRQLYIATSNGGEPRKLTTLSLSIEDLTWSPDGRRLRFCLYEYGAVRRLWEVSLKGDAPRMLLPGWHEAGNEEREGRWTWDGRYFIFPAIHRRAIGLWALPEITASPHGAIQGHSS